MAKTTTKKVNIKEVTKKEIKSMLSEILGQKFSMDEGKKYGFTKDTLVAHTPNCDVQIKIITPKTGVIKYEEIEVEE